MNANTDRFPLFAQGVAVLLHSDADRTVTAQVGTFFKRTVRTGTPGFAHTTVKATGEILYTNRRNETIVIDLPKFEKFWTQGYTHPNARSPKVSLIKA